MSAMSDHIEQVINELLDNEDGAELKRNELAQYFGCAPSQINYVLTTRFSLERGYMIKSKRGGGGHITIMRINVDQDELLHSLTCDGIGEAISQAQARAFVARLRENGCISERESEIMLAACGDLPMVPQNVRDYVRANTLKAMLVAILQSNHEKRSKQ